MLPGETTNTLFALAESVVADWLAKPVADFSSFSPAGPKPTHIKSSVRSAETFAQGFQGGKLEDQRRIGVFENAGNLVLEASFKNPTRATSEGVTADQSGMGRWLQIRKPVNVRFRPHRAPGTPREAVQSNGPGGARRGTTHATDTPTGNPPED